MQKILKTVRLTNQQISTVNSMKGKDFTDKLCSMIDQYDHTILESKRLVITSKIARLKSQHIRMKTALLKATANVDLLISDIKRL